MNPTIQTTKAFLIGIATKTSEKHEASELLDELEGLVQTLGQEVVGKMLLTLREATPSFFVGSGKAEEIKQKAIEAGATALIFDYSLSPMQQRNWERFASMNVYERTEIIIKILLRVHLRKRRAFRLSLHSSNMLCLAWFIHMRTSCVSVEADMERRVLANKSSSLIDEKSNGASTASRNELEMVRKERLVQRNGERGQRFRVQRLSAIQMPESRASLMH